MTEGAEVVVHAALGGDDLAGPSRAPGRLHR